MNPNGWGTPPALHAVKNPPPSPTVTLELSESDRSTILLGPSIGSATLEDGTHVDVICAGKTLEFRVSGHSARPRDFRVDITPLAEAAVEAYRGD